MSYRDYIQDAAHTLLPWQLLEGSTILVVGATGLIGSCIVDVLLARKEANYKVFALGRNKRRMENLLMRHVSDHRLHIINGDVTMPLCTGSSFDYIVHAASSAAPTDFVSHPVEVMKSNIVGVANLIEYGLTHGMRRFLFVSSGEVYGQGDGRVFLENFSGYVDCTKPRSCYPSSKRAAETLCASYAAEYGVDVVIARPCHVYGPHFSDTDNRVYAQFIRNVLNDENIVMKSEGSQCRSWCYVVDCVTALLFVLLKGQSGEAYNVADRTQEITIRALAEKIAFIGGKHVEMNVPSTIELSGFNPVNQSLFSTSKLEMLGWKALSGTMDDKLKATIEERRNSLTL